MGLAELKAKARPVERKLRLCLDGALLAQIADLEERIKAARRAPSLEGDQRLHSELAEARERAASDEVCETFTFRAIGQARYDELLREHPPTEAQFSQWREQVSASPAMALALPPPSYDSETFDPALVAVCCVDPRLTEDEWEEFRRDSLNGGQWAEIVDNAIAVNTARTSRPFYGTATATTPNGGPGSTSPANGVSPSPSSRDGQ